MHASGDVRARAPHIRSGWQIMPPILEHQAMWQFDGGPTLPQPLPYPECEPASGTHWERRPRGAFRIGLCQRGGGYVQQGIAARAQAVAIGLRLPACR